MLSHYFLELTSRTVITEVLTIGSRMIFQMLWLCVPYEHGNKSAAFDKILSISQIRDRTFRLQPYNFPSLFQTPHAPGSPRLTCTY